MTLIILVRHGQTAWNRGERFRGHADVPLDQIGVAQAEATGRRIAEQWKPSAIYAGPLSRTVKTAEAIAHSTGLTVQTEPGLIDVDCGQWQGLTPDKVRQRWPEEFETYLLSPFNFSFPGGESLEEACLRVISRVEEIISWHMDQTIVLVGHTALNRLILLTVLGLDSHSFWKIRQSTCAINVFVTGINYFTLVTLNETSHLSSVSQPQNHEKFRTV